MRRNSLHSHCTLTLRTAIGRTALFDGKDWYTILRILAHSRSSGEMMTLGEFLTKLRREAGWTRARWASAAGISRMTIYRWETDQTLPHVYELAHALKALDAPPRQRRAAFALRESRRENVLRGASLERERMGIHRGDLLRAMRGRRGWSSDETARRIGASSSVMRKWESLHSWPDDERLHQLAYALGASDQELLALSGGIGALERLSPPTFREMFAYIHTLYFLPVATRELEPSLFAMAHRAQTGAHEAEGIADFPIGLAIVHAGLLFREGRVQEARRRFHQAIALTTTQTRPVTRLAAAHANCFMLRGNEPLRPGSPVGSVGRRLWDSLRGASAWAEEVPVAWRAALASERAFAFWHSGDGDAALTESTQSLALAAEGGLQEVAGMMSNRGRLLYEMSRHEQALDELPAYLDLRADIGASLHLYIGLAHQSLGDAPSAHEQLTRARDFAAARRRDAQANVAAAALSRL